MSTAATTAGQQNTGSRHSSSASRRQSPSASRTARDVTVRDVTAPAVSGAG
ncbi:hypothetical protein ACIRSJ_08160 [Streptomyces virginiae]|uniref:hypothetical protein n=1 Tax=Streptomyces virginiae TaxID=1961 RepID=UPI00381AC3D7